MADGTMELESVSGEVVALAEQYPALAGVEQLLAPGEDIEELDLPRIKFPTGGDVAWRLPDGSTAETFDGIVLARVLTKAWWAGEFRGEGDPPDCTAPDNVKGVASAEMREMHGVGGICRDCPMHEWDSGQNGGRACKQVTNVFVAVEGFAMPLHLRLPPTSYKEYQTFASAQQVAGRGGHKALHCYVTRFGLRTKKSRGGQTFAYVAAQKARSLEATEIAVSERVRSEMDGLFAQRSTSSFVDGDVVQ